MPAPWIYASKDLRRGILQDLLNHSMKNRFQRNKEAHRKSVWPGKSPDATFTRQTGTKRDMSKNKQPRNGRTEPNPDSNFNS